MGQTFGPLVGGVLGDHLGWRMTFLVPAAAFVALGALLAPLARHDGPAADYVPGRGPVGRYLDLALSTDARVICLAVAFEGCLFYGAFGYLGAFLRHAFELSYTTIGLLLGGFGVGGIVYSIAVKTLVTRVGPRRMVAAGGWLMLAAFCLLAASPAWTLVAPAVLVLGFAFYLLHNTLQTRATEMLPEARGSAISAFAMCLFLGQAIGVWAAGIGVDVAGYRPVLAGAGLGLALLSAWFGRRLGPGPG
jgi:predicted MFS family arabinose efflux permease